MKKAFLSIFVSLFTLPVAAQDGNVSTLKELLKPLLVRNANDPNNGYGSAALDIDKAELTHFGVGPGDLLFDGTVFIPRNPKGTKQDKGFDDEDRPIGGLALALKGPNGELVCPNKSSDYKKHRVDKADILLKVPYCLKNREGTRVGFIQFNEITEAGVSLDVRVDAQTQAPILEKTNPANDALYGNELTGPEGAH